MKSGIAHSVPTVPVLLSQFVSEELHDLVHGTSFPASPVERQLFYRDDEHTWYQYDGTAWRAKATENYVDTEVAAAVADHANLPSVHHAKYTNAEALAAAAAGLRKLRDADGDTYWWVEKTADEDKIHGVVKGVEAFLLEDDGILTLAKQSGCHAYLTADQTIPHATWTKLNLNGEIYDIQSEFDTAAYKFTAKKAGIHFIALKGAIRAVVDGKFMKAAAYKNGAALFKSPSVFNTTGVEYGMESPIGAFAQLAVDDYLEMYIYHNSFVDRDTFSGSEVVFMMIAKIA